MTKEREALKLALERLKEWVDHSDCPDDKQAITAIKEALAHPEQEPVAYWNFNSGFSHCMIDQLNEAAKKNPAPLYTTPPQRTWVGLTEDDKVLIKHDANYNQFMTAGEYADRVQALTEARLKDKNT